MDSTNTEAENPPSSKPWPFTSPPETKVSVQKQIVENNAPILLVYRNEKGLWVFSNSSEKPSQEDFVTQLLGEVYSRDASVGALSGLPSSWGAWRKTPADGFSVTPVGLLVGPVVRFTQLSGILLLLLYFLFGKPNLNFEPQWILKYLAVFLGIGAAVGLASILRTIVRKGVAKHG